ncbi:MAG: methyltransferase domain-containing protein [Solirubrobacteraceae bacterium]
MYRRPGAHAQLATATAEVPRHNAPTMGDGIKTDAIVGGVALSHYRQEIDLDSDSTHTQVVRLVGTDARVLELGPSSGHMSRVLRDRGCSVVGIELDSEAATDAARYCERMIVGDLDTVDLDGELGSDRFDVIVAADVLEHLKDPLAVVRKLRDFLAPEGFFVISLPNIAHGSVRLAPLQGRFQYQRTGLLDHTHLRFFTRESIGELLDAAELGVAEMFLQRLAIAESEIEFDRRQVPAEVVAALEQDPDATTYQFVIKAVPAEGERLPDMQRQIRQLVLENVQLREAAEHSDAERERLRDEVRSLRRMHDAAEAEIAAHQDQVRLLRVRLDRILTSPPARMYNALRRLPGVKQVAARRTEGYQAAVQDSRGEGADEH